MIRTTLLTETCDVLVEQELSEDEYGDAEKTWATYYFEKPLQCKITPTSSDENEVDRDTRKSWFTLLVDQRAAGIIDALSRVVSEGIQYEVFGEPRVVRRRFDVSHVEASLRIMKG